MHVFQRLKMYSAHVITACLFGLMFLATPLTAGAAFLGSHQVTPLLQPQVILATFEGETKANAKDLVGKLQEATGEITGSTKDKIVGKAKQSESSVDKIMENLKDLAPGS